MDSERAFLDEQLRLPRAEHGRMVRVQQERRDAAEREADVNAAALNAVKMAA